MSRRRDSDAGPTLFFVVLAMLLLSIAAQECDPSGAHAQDTRVQPLAVPEVQLPVTGEILELEQNERAPHAGMLILDEDLVAWRRMIERLTYELVATRSLDAQTCQLRLHEETSRTAAAEDRLTLHEGLWRDRATELSAALAASQAHANDRGFWESPLLWTIVGAVLGGAVVGLIAGALH